MSPTAPGMLTCPKWSLFNTSTNRTLPTRAIRHCCGRQWNHFTLINRTSSRTRINGDRSIPAAEIQSYMQQVQPDMLSFDTYPFDGNLTGGSPRAYYSYMEKYRKLGLAGNDGTGTTPIPVAFWTSDRAEHVRSGSEERLNSFSGWAFGCKGSILFNYTGGAMFPEHSSTTNPTPYFYQAAETNRQSRNLGPALVRLISTDVHMKMGKHAFGDWELNNTLPQRCGKLGF